MSEILYKRKIRVYDIKNHEKEIDKIIDKLDMPKYGGMTNSEIKEYMYDLDIYEMETNEGAEYILDKKYILVKIEGYIVGRIPTKETKELLQYLSDDYIINTKYKILGGYTKKVCGNTVFEDITKHKIDLTIEITKKEN